MYKYNAYPDGNKRHIYKFVDMTNVTIYIFMFPLIQLLDLDHLMLFQQLPVSSGRGRKPAALRRDVSIDMSLCDMLLSEDQPVCHASTAITCLHVHECACLVFSFTCMYAVQL